MILASKGVIPPECWMNNIDDEDIYGNSIKKYLFRRNYVYI